MFNLAAVILSSIIYLMSPSSVKDLSVLERASRLGVQEICINDFFLADSTGAVTDFYRLRDVSNSDFVRFSKAARRKGIKLRTQFNPRYTSTSHPWFQQSMLADSELVFSNFYFWKDTLTQADGTGWALADAPRAKYYRNDGLPGQAALNLEDRSDTSAVLREFANIRFFWAGKGLTLGDEPLPVCSWPHAPVDSATTQYKKIKLVHTMTQPIAVIEEGDEDGLDDFSASLIRFRRKNPAFHKNGSFTDLSGNGAIAYSRSDSGQSFLVVINPGQNKIHFSLKGIAPVGSRPVPVLSEGRAHFNAGKGTDSVNLDFSLGATSLVILKL